ncbi:MAG: hypothetical protein DU429_01355 [Candidatus Tokpelaia sp.]|nr:MAG: hypothetical protein DU430_02985 [Candidatus Tokpelaia sp.]KAA6207709.1 MAG: hypothetical protein DU429_01355 [Candidatus Tokpelaia sp.]KAA6404883.1 hypothetical protein DPQ22_08290 [Candidatus Tokpelaia sp.]
MCFPELESKGRGGHNRKEYALTLDMAKEMCMVERNEKGRLMDEFRSLGLSKIGYTLGNEPLNLNAAPD